MVLLGVVKGVESALRSVILMYGSSKAGSLVVLSIILLWGNYRLLVWMEMSSTSSFGQPPRCAMRNLRVSNQMPETLTAREGVQRVWRGMFLLSFSEELRSIGEVVEDVPVSGESFRICKVCTVLLANFPQSLP